MRDNDDLRAKCDFHAIMFRFYTRDFYKRIKPAFWEIGDGEEKVCVTWFLFMSLFANKPNDAI
jgi:hypothetical protein